MKIGDKILWRFKGEREFRRNDLVEISGEVLFLGHAGLHGPTAVYFRPHDPHDLDCHWVIRREIEIAGDE